MLSDRCLSVLQSVCHVCDVGVLWQTVGWIKMKLGMVVGLGPGHIVLDGDPAPQIKKGHSPQLSVHVCCGQTAGRIKMPLGTEADLGPRDIVLDRDPAPPKKGAQHPNFVPCIVAKRLHGSRCHLVRGQPRPHCYLGIQLP